MRISLNQFVEEVKGCTGTLSAVLHEGSIFFPFNGLKSSLSRGNLLLRAADRSFSVSRKEVYSIEKSDNNSTEYEIITIHGSSILVSVD